MTSSSPAPKLPLWVFYVTDAVLLATAILIATNHRRPWSESTILAIVGCIALGAIALFVPLIARYERLKNEMLDDRQRALEALARTVASSAEQISIATGGLHEIAELAQRNLRHAEQLPHKLQEKIAEFQAQLANANDTEKEELEKELEELRASESERLQSTADRIGKTAAEFAKLEAATQQQLTAANDAVSKLAFGTANAIGKAQAAAEQALSQARQEAARVVAESATKAISTIESAKAAALTDFSNQLTAGLGKLQATTSALNTAIERLERATPTLPAPVSVEPTDPVTPMAEPTATATDATPASSAEAPVEPQSPVQPEVTNPAPRRRKRREEPAPTPATTEPAPGDMAAGALPASPIVPEQPAVDSTHPEPVAVAPEVPPSPEQPPDGTVSQEPAAPAPESSVEHAPSSSAEPLVETPKPARKRIARKSDDSQPGLGLDLDEPNGADATEGGSAVVERVLTSDGATRLIVTAYIGIGNRLFIRGSGPGLSWEKGVPLQFVSIGKWRWETNEATNPVEFKLLKNDEQECSALGALTIDPGHQHEVTATF